MNKIYDESMNMNKSNTKLINLQKLINKEILTQTHKHKYKKYLLISSVGKKSQHQLCDWNYSGKNYDLFLVYYEPDEKVDDEYFKINSDFYLHLYGKKMTHYYHIFQLNLISYYDYVFILDNDNKISGIDISKLFNLATRLDANILAPSIRIKNTDHKIVKKVITFYYKNIEMVNGNFWKLEKYLPTNLIKTYKTILEYTYWAQMVQISPLKDKYIKCTNFVEDGRYIIKRQILDKYRKNIDLMKRFKSGVMFDQLLCKFSEFKKIFICDYIYYIHMDPYKNKEEEQIEGNEIIKYVNKHKIFKNNFVELWPKIIRMKMFKLKDYHHKKKECKF
tara:strand:- start:724 stop:1725 length:1002 start_codon:yes stop_codon:yes gene_type:complete